MKARRVAGESTSEQHWQQWSGLRAMPPVAAAGMVPPASRAVIVAPHPDDEILMAGGLLQQLHALGRECLLVAVTDGAASHPASSVWPVDRLRAVRPAESQAALAALSIGSLDTRRLGLPDAGLAACAPALLAQLQSVLRPGDVVFTTWAGDGHPDHDTCGIQTARAAAAAGANLIEVPVWTWHWSAPEDRRVPWHRARRLPLSAVEVARKRAAVAAFASQLADDASTGSGPVLPPSALARLERDHEIYFL